MDPAKMKVVDLRSELGALGLDTKGNKPALVERLKKALEGKSGKAIPDTSILDTSTEETDEPETPRKPGPASRSRRMSSTKTLPPTPIKPAVAAQPSVATQPVIEEPATVQDDSDDEFLSSGPVRESQEEVQCVDDEKQQSPILIEDEVKHNEKQESTEPMETDQQEESQKEAKDNDNNKEKSEAEVKEEIQDEPEERPRILTEEEEWDEFNERLLIREQERIERERIQAEEDQKRIEELRNDPVKFQRFKRKQEKKARWRNFYRTIEVTNEVLAPPVEDTPPQSQQPQPLMNINLNRNKSDAPLAAKIPEPEIQDDKITLSWYDSDLNQYLEVPDMVSVVPLSDGAFSYCWAGARASHGVTTGRVCYEVRVGATVSTTEENVVNGLRIGWSTDDSSLHLGDGEFSWGIESTGRAVHNGEFKEYGKALNEKDVVGVYLDLQSNPCKMSYTINGEQIGVAHEFQKSDLNGKALYPHVLTKNMCYRVNFGNDRYNMLTKTKIVRRRLEIPIEEVLEEKKAREAEIQRQYEEVKRRERERIEQIRKDREERARKKREERERVERERKEKEAAEKAAAGKNPEEGDAEEQNTEESKVQENGETAEPLEQGDKQQPMETEESKPTENVTATEESAAVKSEPGTQAQDGDVVEMTEEEVCDGLKLDPRIKFVIRFVAEEELDGVEACLLPGYILIAHVNLVQGPKRPESNSDCEVILMVGMPGSGKTHWARQHAIANPEKRYNILSTGMLFEKMKVDCKPFRSSYEGRWDAMVTKCAKCVLKLLEIAQGRRRNCILDQTNVYPSAQRRKLREFDGYRRVAVVVVPEEATYEERQKRREEADGKEVPDGAIMDMKANFSLPEKCSWVDEVIYAELNEEEAKKVVDKFHKEAKAAGIQKEKEKRERSPKADSGPPGKRARQEERRGGGGGGFGRDDRRGGRDFGRDREDRWGGGSRWGPPGGRGGRNERDGGRWGGGGPRDRNSAMGGRFDRPQRDSWGRGGDGFGAGRDFGGRGGGPPDFGGRDFGGREGGFRGGRGGAGGPGGPPSGPPGGPQRDRSGPRSGPPSLLDPATVRNFPPRPNLDNRGGANRGPGGAPEKRPPGNQGTGSWQRGGSMQPQQQSQQQGKGSTGAGSGNRPNQGFNPNQRNQGQNQNKVSKTGSQGDSQNQQGNQAQNWNWNNWGGWGNWNQAQGWGGWNNWANWNANSGSNNQGGSGNQSGNSGTNASGKGQQGSAGQGQWPANYTAQQWYQWQQWQQQQQQQWPGYQNQGGTPEQQQQLWAQYYQNYGGSNTGNAGNTSSTPAVTAEKK